MNYEEKYKQALDRASKLRVQNPFDTVGQMVEHIFPELKEPKDERIRKGLIDFIKHESDIYGIKTWCHGYTTEEIISWLEKQKEFVSADFDDVWETADCNELTAPLEKYSKDAIKKMCHAWYDKGIELERRNWLEKQGDNGNQNWKPSKGQINALEHFVRSIEESGYASPYDDNTKLLKSLMNDLYKLEKQGEQPTDKIESKFHEGD